MDACVKRDSLSFLEGKKLGMYSKSFRLFRDTCVHILALVRIWRDINRILFWILSTKRTNNRECGERKMRKYFFKT